MIEKLWFYPPLAFARLGESNTPLEAFHWGPNDSRPSGTGKTTIAPAQTLEVNTADSSVRPSPSRRIRFRDEQGLKPVCPFFELHCSWKDESGSTVSKPLTQSLLSSFDLKLSDLRLKVKVANLKPFFMTRDSDTRIEAEVEMLGDDFGIRELHGKSPEGARQPLVPEGEQILLGHVILIKPTRDDEVIRLRFYPPKGRVYGPTNFKKRDFGEEKYVIADEFLFLNAGSIWARWMPPPDDDRGLPGGQFASDRNGVSLGLVDDISDGIISCRIEKTNLNLVAHARVVVGPPHFAPDRRHIVTIADGLKDRVGREEVHQASYFSEEVKEEEMKDVPVIVPGGEFDSNKVTPRRMSSLEVNDILERAFETVGLSNLDALNNRVDTIENPAYAILYGERYRHDEHKAFPVVQPTPQRPLPLCELARQQHRRFSALEIFESILRQRPTFFEQWVRPPVSDNPFFDFKMPALMRASSGEPLHLTRRQYDLLIKWAETLRASVKEGS